jgi:phospholipid/cholesterol/gamma-HCH transport system ATP-binding protein
MPSPNHNSGVNVDVHGLHKSYRGQEVLKGLDFKVQPGEVFVIMGPSGSGKSVLLRHLIGLEPPDSGEILIQGEPVCCGQAIRQYRLSMVFQSGALLNSLTVGENVGLYLAEHRLKKPDAIARLVSETLQVVGLKGTENKMPSELSGGMKKRVALARALITEPQLILYDEPTSELDPISSVVIAREIVKLNRRIGVTSLVVTHERELAFGIADRIAVMTDGRIVAIGRPEEIRNSSVPEINEFLNADLKLVTQEKTS